MVLKAVKLLEPQGMLLCPFEIEPPGEQHLLKRYVAEVGLYDTGIGVEGAYDST